MEEVFRLKYLFDYAVHFYFEVGADGVFAICIITAFAVFLIALIKAIFMRGYDLKKKLVYLSFVFGLCLLELGVFVLSNEGFGFCVLTIGFGVVSFALLASIRTKEKTRKEEREFVKFIDESINMRDNQQDKIAEEFDQHKKFDFSTTNKEFPSTIVSHNSTCKKHLEIDFSHVKNVLEKMEFFTLSPNDRKQVKDLQTAVFTAEQGGLTEDIKTRINDGLSALLKIMAKYGI